MLKIQDVHAYYGKSHILQGVSLDVNEGEVVALLGRNGVGKTTTLKTIMGINPPKQGSIHFHYGDKETNITSLPSYKIAQLGIGYVPEDRRIFTHLTTLENLRTGLDLVYKNKQLKEKALEEVFQCFPRLGERKNQTARTLSGGEQQMLAIARVMVTKPKLVLMDEPSEGLMPLLVAEIRRVIKQMRDEGFTILLIDQDFKMCLEISDRAYIMEKGIIRYQGETKELVGNKEILFNYLGVS
jgi:branched-chain amino acid transport system ATP-binding protein